MYKTEIDIENKLTVMKRERDKLGFGINGCKYINR